MVPCEVRWVEGYEMVNISKLGFNIVEDSMQIVRTTLLWYGDVLVVPMLFWIAKSALCEKVEFLDAKKTQTLAAVVERGGMLQVPAQYVLLYIGSADATEDLLSAKPSIQHAVTELKIAFSKEWGEAHSITEDRTGVIVHNPSFIQRAISNGKEVLSARERDAKGNALSKRDTRNRDAPVGRVCTQVLMPQCSARRR